MSGGTRWPQPLAFVDLETTGATATADRITEVGIVLVDESGVSEWSTLVDPETSIPGFIQSLTGITDAMVRGAPTFGQVAGEILERLQGRLFVAHNARFDYGFLKNEFRRVGVDFRATVLCTVKLSRRLYPQHRKHSLDALIERHQLQPSGRHRALADAQLLHQFWQWVERSGEGEALGAAVKELTARPSLPVHIDAAVVDDLPEAPGVYLFYGENALPLYVGKAKDIKKRVLSHFAADHGSAKEMSLAQQLRRVEWIRTGGEVGALLKEAALIKQLQPSHNRQLRRNDELCSICLVDEGAGLVKPRVVFARDLDFGEQKNLFGLFKSAKEATQVLQDVAAGHGLCHAILGLEKVKPGRPCFARQVRKCQGACVGEESLIAHTLRLTQALGSVKLKTWPFAGPAILKEGEGDSEEALVLDRWCYLGAARSEDELARVLQQERPPFDRDTYRVLVKALDRLQPVAIA